jgi:hypothetical protein
MVIEILLDNLLANRSAGYLAARDAHPALHLAETCYLLAMKVDDGQMFKAARIWH